LTQRLRFEGAAKGAIETVEIDIQTVIADGRRIAPAQLTQARLTQADNTIGIGTALLAHPVLVGGTDRLWLTVGAVSATTCPVGRQAWRFEEVEPQWDRLVLRSFANGRLLREERLAALGSARDLIVQATGSKRLAVGVALFCGASSAAIAQMPFREGALELEDAVLGRTLTYGYS
jgi:hypothetical protein